MYTSFLNGKFDCINIPKKVIYFSNSTEHPQILQYFSSPCHLCSWEYILRRSIPSFITCSNSNISSSLSSSFVIHASVSRSFYINFTHQNMMSVDFTPYLIHDSIYVICTDKCIRGKNYKMML